MEDFWAVYNWILPPSWASQLRASSDYSLFREGVRPDWEDPGNVRGGRWVVVWSREALDTAWRELLMVVVGGRLGEGLGELITGAVVNVRGKSDKLGLWVREGGSERQDRYES